MYIFASMCVVLSKKSNKSLEAGDILCKAELHTQAIHCFYYAGLQYMLYYSKKNKINLEKFKNQYNKDKKDNEKLFGTHEVLFHALKDKVEIKNRRNYQKKFHRLKQARVNADYRLKFFSRKEAMKLKNDVIEFIDILDTKK